MTLFESAPFGLASAAVFGVFSMFTLGFCHPLLAGLSLDDFVPLVEVHEKIIGILLVFLLVLEDVPFYSYGFVLACEVLVCAFVHKLK